jgi:1-acyl-sn-glycerol-3-phosphate acyltransferase
MKKSMNKSGIGPPRIRKIQVLLGVLFLAVTGWKVAGSVPADMPKFVLVLAPHTSNWDLPFILAVMYALGLKINWFGKKELFAAPFGGVLKWLGGIPIDRSSHQNMVQQTAQTIREREQIVIGIAPEGTRSQSSYWSTGFYYIASLAQVPIVFGYLDYARKVGGLGPVMRATGNIEADMKVIREFYSGITAKYPYKVGEIIVSQRAWHQNSQNDNR